MRTIQVTEEERGAIFEALILEIRAAEEPGTIHKQWEAYKQNLRSVLDKLGYTLDDEQETVTEDVF